MNARPTLLPTLLALCASLMLAQPAAAQSATDRVAPVEAGAPVGLEKFFQTAASSNRLEIESSQLASRTTTSREVAAFAKRMLADHNKAQEELRNLARAKNVALKDELLPKHQAMLQDLRAAGEGEAFNREFRKLQVASHQESISLFEGVAKSVKDEQVQALVNRMLPVLREHLQMAQKLPASAIPDAQ